MKLVYVSAAWVAGIYAGSRLPLPWGIALGLLVAVCLILLPVRRHKQLLLALICLAVFLGGTLRFALSLPAAEATLGSYNDSPTPVILRGLVAESPEPGGSTTRLRLAVRQVKEKEEEAWNPASGGVLVYGPRYWSYRYGDMIEVRGALRTPDSVGDFDYREYLARQGIGSVMSYPTVKLLARSHGNPALAWLHNVRSRLSQSLAVALPEPQAALAQSMLLGRRNELPSDLKDALYRSGTGHLIAISGLHIAVVAGLGLSASAWLLGRRRPTYLVLACFAVWGYAVLAGLPASAVRAAIMASLILLAIHLGRQSSAPTALAFAAATMVGVTPRVLWDVGFQLSVLAMAGLIFITPRLQNDQRPSTGSFDGLRTASGQRGSIFALALDGLTYSAGPVLATLPLVAYNFHRISTLSLPATLVAVPALPALIVTSAATATVGLVSTGLAQALGLVAWPFLTYTVKVAELFAALPGATFQVAGFNGLLVLAYFVLLSLCLWPRAAMACLRPVTRWLGGAVGA